MNRQKSEKKRVSRRRKTNSISLQTRFVLFVLLVALVPLITIAIRDIRQTQQALTNGAEISLRTSATQTANSLDTFIQVTLDSVRTEAQFVDFITYLTISVSSRSGPVETRALNILDRLSKKGNASIISYALVDTDGNVLLDSQSSNTGKNEANEAYYPLVRFNEQAIVTPVTYAEDKTTSLTFASKVLDENGGYIGILRAKFKSSVLQDVITSSIGQSADVSVLLLDQLNIRMADSRNPDLVLKSIAPLIQIDYLLAVDTHRFLDIPREEQATNYVELELALDSAAAEPFFRADITPDVPGDDTIAVAFMKTQPWTVVFSRPTSIFLADVQKQTRTNTVLVVAASALIAIITTMVVRNLTNPIISLTKTASLISQGDFTARAAVKTRDEIGTLATTFNEMSAQIRDLVTGLENRVTQRTMELEQRTSELERITQQSEKRAGELQAITEIARSISTEKDLENLLPLITQIVSDRFGYYHVGIFLLNESKDFAVLRAANSPGGQKMLARQHRLEVGQVGIVGNVTSTGKPRIALDTGADAVFFNNPDLPETHSEMALPLTARGVIIGALDVQSVTPNAFTDADVNILSLLADQIAIAIDNVRLLGETRTALAESESVFKEYLASSWAKKTSAEAIGFLQTISGGQLITGKASQKRGISAASDKDTLVVPIQLRDQEIGTLNIRSNSEGRVWSADEMGIMQAVAERLGLALDNARLFEETSSRASRERLVSDITTKIRSTNDPEEMIKTAVEELKNALGVTRVEIVAKNNVPPPDK